MNPVLKRLAIATSAVALLAAAPQALAFCGFFVAKGDAKLFNEASRVVLVRDGNRTVLTMVNDFQGDARDFAMVVPAPPSCNASRSTSPRTRSSTISTHTPPPAWSSTTTPTPANRSF